jgi:hypothetical protein
MFINFIKKYKIFERVDDPHFTTHLLQELGKNESNQSPSEYFLYMIDHFKLEEIVEYTYTLKRVCLNCKHTSTTTDKSCTFLVNKIEELGLKAIRIFLPAGMDPDDFTQKFDVSLLDETILKMIDSGKKTLNIRVDNG